MNYQDYMTGINAEHIMAKMDYERISSDAHNYRSHNEEFKAGNLISIIVEKLGNLLITTGESMKHYAELHVERPNHEAA